MAKLRQNAVLLARVLVVASAAAFAWGLPSPSMAADLAGSQRYAFLVGVNDYSTYEDDGLRNLSFCVADMKSLQEKLEGIGFKRVYCLTTESTTAWQPSKAQIEKRLEALLADADMASGDFVLVALSGHGLELEGVGGASTAYFCPADGHSERIETLLPVMWFYRQLAESKAGMKMLLVDACRNLAESRAGSVKPELSTEARDFMKSLADTSPPKGIAALLSCQSGQFSHEVPELGHGVFMHHVLEGLSGKADLTAGNRDGWVSLSELFNFAADQTEEYVDTKCPVRYSAQTPILRGDLPNYKLVRLDNVPRLEMPSEIVLAFTVVERADGIDKPIDGATVEVLYRRAIGVPEGSLGTAISDSDGHCTVTVPGFWAAMQGEFLASVSRGSQTERFTVDLRDEDRAWQLSLPKPQPVVSVPRPSPMPPRPSSPPSQTLPGELTNSIGMKLKLIPAGEFMMGSPESEEARESDEGPQHRVRITRPFYLGVYEVTQAEYEQVMGDSPSNFKGATLPVENVSWEDATEFCRRLIEKEGREYRLPTEAEWEYACRAGTTTAYSFGSDSSDLDSHAWHSTNSDETHPVGQKHPNAWGLYDMHGNVWEWCADWYDLSYYANSPVDDPTGPTSGAGRVDRGGGWDSYPRYCRSAIRDRDTPGYRDVYLGFRVAQVPAE